VFEAWMKDLCFFSTLFMKFWYLVKKEKTEKKKKKNYLHDINKEKKENLKEHKGCLLGVTTTQPWFGVLNARHDIYENHLIRLVYYFMFSSYNKK
jgi:hypothetical protein